MAPRTIYANLADGLQPFSLWDQSLADMGSLGVIPCAASGTNTIALTPVTGAFAPNPAYSNNNHFCFVAAATSSGAVTINIGGLGAKALFQSDGTTPVAASALVSGSFYEIAYGSSLAAGAGGFYLLGGGASAAGITVGTTAIGGGTANGLLYNNAGVLGNLATIANGVLQTDVSGVPAISTSIHLNTAPLSTVTRFLSQDLAIPFGSYATFESGQGTGPMIAHGITNTQAGVTASGADSSGITVFMRNLGTASSYPASTFGALIRAIEGHAVVDSSIPNGTRLGTWAMELGLHSQLAGDGTSKNLGIYLASSHTGILPSGVRNDSGILIGGEDGWTHAIRYLDTDGTTLLFDIDQTGIVVSRGSVITSSATTALSVGLNGTTNPALQVDASTASQAAGLKIKGAVTGGNVAVSAIDSGANTNLLVDAKGTGAVGINSVTGGPITLGGATTASSTLLVGTSITDPVLIGGSAAGSSLEHRSTSGVGTTDFQKFTVGNNGATEAMRITHNGHISIGSTTGSNLLNVGDDLGASGAVAALSVGATTGGLAGTSQIVVGQGANNIQMTWNYNATAGNATGTIATAGLANPITISGSNVQLQPGGGTTFFGGPLIAISAAGSLGFGPALGAGGTVAQATSKATAVTLSKPTGQITMNAAALAAGAIVSFTLTNTTIAATDVLILNHISGGTAGAYSLNAQAAAGSASINVLNNTAGSLSEAIVIQFVVIKGATN